MHFIYLFVSLSYKLFIVKPFPACLFFSAQAGAILPKYGYNIIEGSKHIYSSQGEGMYAVCKTAYVGTNSNLCGLTDQHMTGKG